MTILLTILATVALTVVVMNFMTGEKKIDKAISPLYAVSDPQFLRSMGSLLGPALKDGNRVTCFSNGDAIFKAMLDAIAGARRSISFETYIYWSGQIGSRFVEALSERARAGVKVHVLLDWAGSSSMDDEMVEALVAAGAEVEKYHEPRWYSLSRMNNRTHRKGGRYPGPGLQEFAGRGQRECPPDVPALDRQRAPQCEDRGRVLCPRRPFPGDAGGSFEEGRED